MVRQYCSTSWIRGITQSNALMMIFGGRSLHHGQNFGKAEGADQRRNQRDAAGQIVDAEGEAVIGIHAFLADRGDEQPEEARDPALQRIAAGEIAGNHHAEHREPEELIGAEFQCYFAKHGREQCERQHADPGAEHGARRRDAHRTPGEALPRQRVAVEAGGSGSGRAGDVEQDGAAAAAVDRADIGADQDKQRDVRGQRNGERRHQRDAHGGGQAGQRADDEPDQARAERIENRSSASRNSRSSFRKAGARQTLFAQGRRTRNKSWNV